VALLSKKKMGFIVAEQVSIGVIFLRSQNEQKKQGLRRLNREKTNTVPAIPELT
jgi:hypothetical protein